MRMPSRRVRSSLHSSSRKAGRADRSHIAYQAEVGIILAHGGSTVGYVLYAKDGNLFFSVRLGQNAVQKIAFGSPGKKMEITASLTKEKFSIQVGEKSVEAKSHGLLNRHPQEDICIGHDDKNPVASEAPKSRINGKLSNLKVSVGAK